MPRMSKKRKQEWALFLNERNRITYNGLFRKYSSEFSTPTIWCVLSSTPTISLPPCVLAKATIVFMYFSLLSGKDTLYSIFFDSPENIVSSTILSLLIYTRTTGTSNSISRVNISGSLTLLYVLFFFSSKQENKTVHFFLPFSSVLFLFQIKSRYLIHENSFVLIGHSSTGK